MSRLRSEFGQGAQQGDSEGLLHLPVLEERSRGQVDERRCERRQDQAGREAGDRDGKGAGAHRATWSLGWPDRHVTVLERSSGTVQLDASRLDTVPEAS